MRKWHFLLVLPVVALLATPAAWAAKGVTELSEGVVRTTYVDAPQVGAKGYVVADWENGQIRVEVSNFPPSANGYEVFLVQVDAPAFMAAMFVNGDPNMGIVANPPPFDAVGALISQWRSIGDLTLDGSGNGTLAYEKGDNIAETGLNVMMIFGKVTPGQHEGPEDFSKLMVECNGPLQGLPGDADAMASAMSVFPQ